VRTTPQASILPGTAGCEALHQAVTRKRKHSPKLKSKRKKTGKNQDRRSKNCGTTV